MADLNALKLIASIVTAQTEPELFGRLQLVAAALGFERGLFGIQIKTEGVKPQQHIASGWPDSYQRLYSAKDFQSRDPTVHQALRSEDLLVWRESMYSNDSYQIMEESQAHGIGFGMSIPIHEGSHIRSILSLARDKAIECPNERAEMEAGIRVLAQCAHVSMSRILKPTLFYQAIPKLTPRELECLKWAAQGKSTGVTADILNVSDSAVKFHMKNVFAKLNVANKTRAVAVGISIGLIT